MTLFQPPRTPNRGSLIGDHRLSTSCGVVDVVMTLFNVLKTTRLELETSKFTRTLPSIVFIFLPKKEVTAYFWTAANRITCSFSVMFWSRFLDNLFRKGLQYWKCYSSASFSAVKGIRYLFRQNAYRRFALM